MNSRDTRAGNAGRAGGWTGRVGRRRWGGHASRLNKGFTRAFTLIEVMVVLGIIVVLAALLVPALSKVVSSASRTATASDLAAIATALEAYKQDFGDYPRVRETPLPIPVAVPTADRPNAPSGSQILCFALLAPAPATETPPAAADTRAKQDGSDGPGFRLRRTAGNDDTMNTADDEFGSKVYPPYLPPDRFKTVDPTTPATPEPLRLVIVDRYEKPILYFPASPAKQNLRVAAAAPAAAPFLDVTIGAVPTAIACEASRYDGNDDMLLFGNGTVDAAARDKLRMLLGDKHGAAATAAPDGVIQADEQPAELPFILWSAGPNEIYGPVSQHELELVAKGELDRKSIDDVSNIPD